MTVADAGISMTVRCAWCGRIIKRGKPSPVPAVSHGLCRNCFARELVLAEQVLKGKRPS